MKKQKKTGAVNEERLPCPGENLERILSVLNDFPDNIPKKPIKEESYTNSIEENNTLSEQVLKINWQRDLNTYERERKLFDMISRYGENQEEVRRGLGEHVKKCKSCCPNYMELLKNAIKSLIKMGKIKTLPLSPKIYGDEEKMKKREIILSKFYFHHIKIFDENYLNVLRDTS